MFQHIIINLLHNNIAADILFCDILIYY